MVLPTGMGKTIIALLVIAKELARGNNILFLSPTKPLVNQHAQSLNDLLSIENAVAVFTGEIPPEKRVLFLMKHIGPLGIIRMFLLLRCSKNNKRNDDVLA